MAVTKNIVKQPKAVVEVQIIMPWADVAPKWEQVLQKIALEVELPGFRKGTAPLPMVEQHMASKVQDEVVKTVMPQALVEALQGTNIVPIDYPQYMNISFVKGQDLKFTAKVTERPTVTVGDYKAVKAPKPQLKEVTDEEVAKVIDDLFKRWKARLPAGQARQPANQPSAASSQTSAPQSNTSQPQNGTSGSLDFNTAPSAGEQAQAAPQPTASSDSPDDNFAKAVGAQDLNDLKVKIRQDLESENKYNSELDYEEAILQEVEKITQVDIPDILIQDELNRMLLSLQRNVSERGLLLDEYLKSQNKTVESLKNEWKPQAEKNVRMELGLSEIARQENVNISDEELQAEIDKIQDAKVKSQFAQQEPRMHLRHALRQTKTLNLLKTLVGV